MLSMLDTSKQSSKLIFNKAKEKKEFESYKVDNKWLVV